MVALLALTILGTVIGTILAVEASAWMPYLGHRLIRSALSRFPEGLPAEVRARWAEEIEADFASFADRPWGGLVFAIGVRWKGARRLAAELAPRRIKATASRSKSKHTPPPAAASDRVPAVRYVTSYKFFGGRPMPRYIRIPEPTNLPEPTSDEGEEDE